MNSYSCHFLDETGEPLGGAAFPAADDESAEDDARACALGTDCSNIRILNQTTGRTWTILPPEWA